MSFGKSLFRHRLQRLENDEREAERDLIRLNHDRIRASLSSISNRALSSRPSTQLFRSRTPRLSTPIDSLIQRSSRTKLLFERPFSVNRTSIDRFIPSDGKRLSNSTVNSMTKKFPWICKPMQSNFDENPSYLRVHVDSINQQKRDIEQKLKEFLQ